MDAVVAIVAIWIYLPTTGLQAHTSSAGVLTSMDLVMRVHVFIEQVVAKDLASSTAAGRCPGTPGFQATRSL